MAKRTPKRRMNVYANLSHKRRTRKDQVARKKAEYLASLPKHPVKRMLYRLNPKRLAKFWFSKAGLMMGLKIAGLGILALFLLIGGLFAYYRKDLDQIRPSELAKRVQTTVTRYYDRNNTLLWEDKGDGDYKLVVDGKEIAKTMKLATVAIEDKDFYHHNGISVPGMVRAVINNSRGQSAQGGSTLTQQLVKQVFFSSESSNRGLGGIPRKIKEMILAVEVERMYKKEQILDLYLNESPYGGRRNGVESAAQTYFGKSAKTLNLPESALLAAIPNSPALYDPYTGDKDALISRQHKVLDAMVDQKDITKDQAEAAKKVPILDSIQPQTDQYKNIKAPHFVMMVRGELERQLGKATVGRGGLNITTTLDLRIQTKLEQEMRSLFNSYYPGYAGFSNGAGTIEDVKTGQILAMLGSRGFNYPGYGQANAATAFIQPGSSIKPLVFAQLFQNKGAGALNFGSGSVLSDTRTYFPGYGYSARDADGSFKGNITLRNSLAWSRNIPALKAMQISGIEPTLKTIRLMGDTYYCTQGNEKQTQLSSAIGGCGTRMVDHVNALGSLARGGVYTPHSSILKVTNNNGDILKEYKKETKRIVDTQAAYVVTDILGDARARAGLFGRTITPNMDVLGAKIAIKTGTSDKNLEPKDIWTTGYTPSLAGAIWLGNSDTTPLINGNSSIPALVLDPVMAFATQLYQKEGKAPAGDWFKQPAGIQRFGIEAYPAWYNRAKSMSGVKMNFDKVSKKKATKCTPASAVVSVDVIKTIDPVSKSPIYLSQDGYDATKDDDVHKCGDAKPAISGITVDGDTISVRVDRGKFSLDTLSIRFGNESIASMSVKGSGTYTTRYSFTKSGKITATVTDEGYYSDTYSQTYTLPATP